jgi:lipopolysaccharide export system protein LptA
MSRPIAFTASACALAACVLVATVLFSPSLPEPVKRDRPLADPTKPFRPLDPNEKYGKPDGPIAPEGVVEKYYIRKYNEARKQLTILSGERANPKPNGVVDIERITAHIHLIPGRRVLEIRGPRGTLVAPENNPESGVLSGGVVLTLFESPENQDVRLAADSPDVRLRMYLDEDVNFDLVLGFVESAGPVHITSPRVDFKGTGLNLIYNEKRRRINRLEITHGKEMRFNPNAPLVDPSVKAAKPPVTPTQPATTPKPSEAPREDYYRAVFDTDVLVRTADAVIDAGRMELLFSLSNREDDAGPVKAFGAAGTSRKLFGTSAFTGAATENAAPPDRSMMKPSPDDVIVNWTGKLLVDPLEEKPADLTGPDDTMIVLEKRVRVHSVREETITAERVEYLTSAARVRIIGDALDPAVVQSGQFGVLRALDLVINQKTGIGTITGPGAIISSGGEPRAGVRQIVVDGKPVPAPASTKLPPGVSLTWTQGADLTFQVKHPAKKAVGKTGGAGKSSENVEETAEKQAEKKPDHPTLNATARLDALEDAVFHGNVEVEHPQFDLKADTLAIAMTAAAPPTHGDAPGTKEKQEPQQVKATGNVSATARGEAGQPPMDIEAGDLEITFAADARGDAQPTRMLATGQVRTSQPGRVLTAGLLDVTLAEAPPKPTPAHETAKPVDAKPKPADAKSKAPASRLAISRILAEQDVNVTMQSPRTVVTAHRLEGETLAGLLEVFGTAAKPARIERDDDSLTGRHITLRESDQYVTVSGPGTAEFVTTEHVKAKDPAKESGPAAGNEIAKPPAPQNPAAPATRLQVAAPQTLKIAWLHAMDFNNTTGIAHFHGQVVAGSERGLDVTRFRSDDLTLELDPIDPKHKSTSMKDLLAPPSKADTAKAPEKQADPTPSTPAKADAKPKKDETPPRAVRRMIAKEKVVFEADKWADKVDGKLETRFRLTGPLLTFNNNTGKLDVTGEGTMLIEDYRAKEKAKAKPAVTPAPANGSNPVAFVGQGVTLFLWQSAMSIDANHTDVRMERNVKMIQQPASGNEIHMQCQELMADFQSTGGLNSWLTGKAAEPKLDNVSAAGSLVIIYGKQTVRGDQLYYTGHKQMAIISAEEGKQCELDTEQTTLPARQFRWFLDRDRIVAEEPGAIRTRIGAK